NPPRVPATSNPLAGELTFTYRFTHHMRAGASSKAVSVRGDARHSGPHPTRPLLRRILPIVSTLPWICKIFDVPAVSCVGLGTKMGGRHNTSRRGVSRSMSVICDGAVGRRAAFAIHE